MRHPGDDGWNDATEEEKLTLMQNMHDSYLQTRDLFDQVFWDEELRRDWKDVLNNIGHDGGHDAGLMKNWLDRKKPDSGWLATAHTFRWIRLMNFIMHLRIEDQDLL